MTGTIIVLLLLVVGLLFVLAAVRKRARTLRLKSAPELKPESLVELSVTTAASGTGDLSNAKDIAVNCALETAQVQSYSTEILLRDPTISELESRGYIAVDWKAEYMRPGRYHVLQSTWSRLGYQYDEWVAVGEQLHENVGQWKVMPENKRVDWNEALRADKYVAIMRDTQPRSAHLYRYRGVYYYLLTYNLPSLSGFGPFAQYVEGGPFQIQMWVHRTTGLLARVDVIGHSSESAEPTATPDFEQVFWAYNEPIQIAPPEPPPQIEIPEA
jgi:hypothetical protein